MDRIMFVLSVWKVRILTALMSLFMLAVGVYIIVKLGFTAPVIFTAAVAWMVSAGFGYFTYLDIKKIMQDGGKVE